MASIEEYAQVVRDGQKEGKIPAHVDPEQVAWLITGWAFAGDVSHLMGFKAFLEPNIGVHWLDVIFASFAAGTGGGELRRAVSAKSGCRNHRFLALTPPGPSTIICGRV